MTKDEKIFCDMQIQIIVDEIERLAERLDFDIDQDEQFNRIFQALHTLRLHINPAYADFIFNMQLAKSLKKRMKRHEPMEKRYHRTA